MKSGDWVLPDGQILPLPNAEEARGQKAYDYCRQAWCIGDERQSLFTYRNGRTLETFSMCDAPFRALPTAGCLTESIRDLCGLDQACIVDGIVGGIEGARNTLLESIESQVLNNCIRALRVEPPVVVAGESTTLFFGLKVGEEVLQENVVSFTVYFEDKGSKLLTGFAAILTPSSEDPSLYLGSTTVQLDNAGESQEFRVIPVVNDSEDFGSDLAATFHNAVKAFSASVNENLEDGDSLGTNQCIEEPSSTSSQKPTSAPTQPPSTAPTEELVPGNPDEFVATFLIVDTTWVRGVPAEVLLRIDGPLPKNLTSLGIYVFGIYDDDTRPFLRATFQEIPLEERNEDGFQFRTLVAVRDNRDLFLFPTIGCSRRQCLDTSRRIPLLINVPVLENLNADLSVVTNSMFPEFFFVGTEATRTVQLLGPFRLPPDVERINLYLFQNASQTSDESDKIFLGEMIESSIFGGLYELAVTLFSSSRELFKFIAVPQFDCDETGISCKDDFRRAVRDLDRLQSVNPLLGQFSL